MVGFNLDDVSHFEIFAVDFFGPCFFDESICMVVGLFISFFAVIVVVGLFEKSESEYKCEWCDVSEEETYFEHIDELTECDE